ncbi:MAG: hypothetical protein HGB00_02520 [Chlorobiaceae bacterium]|nr:hypothetical protein [Chlorobiaceae bacterium]
MHTVKSDPHFLFVLMTGKVDQLSLHEAQKELMLHPDYAHKNTLWMFDEACECDFSNFVMFEMLNRIKVFFPIESSKQKAALVGVAPMHYSFLKLFCDEAEHEGLPFKVQPFHSYQEAEAWLLGHEV